MSLCNVRNVSGKINLIGYAWTSPASTPRIRLRRKVVSNTQACHVCVVWSQGLNTGNPAQALIQSKHQEGPVKTLPVQLQQELERHRTAQSKWDGDKFGPQNGGWPLDVQARSFVQNGLNFGTAPMPVSLLLVHYRI